MMLRSKKHLAAGTLILLIICAGLVFFLNADPPRTPNNKESTPRPLPYERVLLITLDTTRADHLASYGYLLSTTPFIDKLAREGIQFINAYSASNMTVPSHATLFSSQYPIEHGARNNFIPTNKRYQGIFQHFKKLGFSTAAFTACRFMSRVKLDRGLDLFSFPKEMNPEEAVYTIPGEKYPLHVISADMVVSKAISWLDDRRADEKLFLWIHLFDPHQWEYKDWVPKGSLENLQKQVDKKALSDFLKENHGNPFEYFGSIDTGLQKILQYDAQLSFADSQVERLFKYLQQKKLSEKSLWIIAGDHGEGLGNHNYHHHEDYLYQEQLRVPLILYSSSGLGQATRISSPVSLIDLAPTLGEIFNFSPSPPHSWNPDSRSLLALMESRSEEPTDSRQIFSEKGVPLEPLGSSDSSSYSLQDTHYKLIRNWEGNYEFFSLDKDPHEAFNLLQSKSLSAEDSSAYDRLRKDLEEKYAPQYNSVSSTKAKNPTEKKVIKELKSLGYL